MQGETRFKNKALPILRKIPGSWWVKVQQVTIRGTPDIVGCVHGIFVAWELKDIGGCTSRLQEYHIKAINDAGGWARVVSPENLEEELQNLYNLPKLLAKRSQQAP
jgi:hypothetical protein